MGFESVKPFVQSGACRSLAHCVTCRARTMAGDRFRSDLAAKYEPPAGWVCPYGIPWDIGESLLTRFLRTNKIGTKIERATRSAGIKPCKGCKKRKAILDGEHQ